MKAVSVCSLLYCLCLMAASRAEEPLALLQKLSDSDEKVRLAAVKNVEALGGKEAIAALAGALRDSSWDVRLAAGEALVRSGPDALAVLLPALLDLNAETRSGAAWVLGRLKPECVPALLKSLKDDRPEIRAGARRAIEKIGAAGVSALVAGFKEADADLGYVIVEILGSYGATAKDAVPVLIEGLKARPGTALHEKIAETFAKIGPGALSFVLSALQNDSAEIRSGAIHALGFFPATEPRVVPTLIETLKDTAPAVREAGARALGEIGPGAAAAVPGLLALLKEERADIRLRALDALSRIDSASKTVVAELIVGMKDPEPTVQLKAIEALSRTGAAAEEAIPSLMENLKDESVYIRVQTMRTLSALLPRSEAPDAHLALLEALQDKNAEIRSLALTSLGRMLALPAAQAASSGGVPKDNLATVYAALNRGLKDDIPSVRARAAEVLAQNPAAAAGSVPAFVAAMRDVNLEVRLKSVEALGALGPGARAAVPALIAALTELGHAKLIGETIRKIGLDGRTDVTLLLEAFPPKASPTLTLIAAAEGRAQIASLLGSIGPAAVDAVPQLVPASHERAPVGTEAAAALKLIDPTSKATVPVLIAQMKSKVPETRLAAVEFARRLGPAAAAAGPALIDAARDDDAYVRESAVVALGLVAPPSKAAVAALINALKSNARVARAASLSLMRTDAESLPLLVAALKDDSADVRRGVSMALEKMPAAIPLLAAALKENSTTMRRSIAALIPAIGPAARSCVPGLIECLKDSSSTTQSLTTKAFESIGADAVPALLTALKEGTAETRKALLPILAQMGPAAKDAAPALVLLLRDENAMVKSLTLKVLERLGPGAVSELTAALSSEDPEVKRMAVSALGNLGAAAKSAVPSLLAMQKDDSGKLRRYAVNSLRQIAPEDPAVMAGIIAATKDEDPVVRMAAIKNLGSLGAAGKDGVPALIEALRDEDWDNRASAATALEDIGVPARKLFPNMDVAVNEIRALQSCIAYGRAQEQFRLKDQDKDGVLEYAQAFKGPDAKRNAGLCDAALLPRLFADAEGPPGGTASYRGYRFKILKSQSGEKVPGGAKAYIENGNMIAGHAMAAYPAEYGASGRSVFIINYTGNIYEKDLKSAEETKAYIAGLAEFRPDETWTHTRQVSIDAPAAARKPAFLKGMGEVKEDTTF